MTQAVPAPSFFKRFAMAFVCFFRLIFSPRFAATVLPAYEARKSLPSTTTDDSPTIVPVQVVPSTPEKEHASALYLLAMLQREGRLVDFLQEEVASFSDSEVGAAARIVHQGCRKVVQQYLALEPVLKDSEGARVSVPQGFDAQRIRLTGNVPGQPPFQGSLKHHGWATTHVKLPDVPAALDLRVIAPAEVELS
jgi:hypothetical protein